MKTSVALIGFMGTGKTAVGKLLADRLGKRFIELDSLIEEKAGEPIPRIFARLGEIGFRELEIEATREVAGKKDVVIACGGGIVLNRINIDRLAEDCVIVRLTASPSVTLRRTSGDSSRPLLEVSDRLERIKTLMRFREPFYQRAADFTVNTSKIGIEAVEQRIIDELKENESFH